MSTSAGLAPKYDMDFGCRSMQLALRAVSWVRAAMASSPSSDSSLQQLISRLCTAVIAFQQHHCPEEGNDQVRRFLSNSLLGEQQPAYKAPNVMLK